MSLVVLGTNHKTAKLDLRERWSYQVDEIATTLENISKKLNVEEVALLSTCNRTEVYCDIDNPDRLINWFNTEISPYTSLNIEQHGYVYQNKAAVSHMMRVASGLDSLVIGEPQILGQFKQAYRLAKKAKTLGKKFDKLFSQTFSVAKTIRNNTDIGLHSMSVASISADLVQSEFTEMSHQDLNVLLIGSGDTIKTVGRSLLKHGIGNLTIANRNCAHAHDLAEDLKSHAFEKYARDITVTINGLNILEDAVKLSQFDVVFTATSSPVPLLHKNTIAQRNSTSKLLLIDLAVPRDIEPGCVECENICLYTVDDLEKIITKNSKQRQLAALQAEKIINSSVEDFCDWESSLLVMASLCQYREQAEQMCEDVIQKAHKRLDAGHDTKEVLVSSLQLLRNKLLHHPTITLKSLAKQNNNTEVDLLKDLFNL